MNLRHPIEVLRPAVTVTPAGTPVTELTRVAGVRAEVLERSTEEFFRSAGDTDETTIVFRTRWFSDVATGDRIKFGSDHYEIKEIKEIGRRQWLEIRCIAKEGE